MLFLSINLLFLLLFNILKYFFSKLRLKTHPTRPTFGCPEQWCALHHSDSVVEKMSARCFPLAGCCSTSTIIYNRNLYFSIFQGFFHFSRTFLLAFRFFHVFQSFFGHFYLLCFLFRLKGGQYRQTIFKIF
jgi:hypothetical protein